MPDLQKPPASPVAEPLASLPVLRPAPLRPRHVTLRLSWVLLTGSFVMCCVLIGAVLYGLLLYRANALEMRTATLIVRSPVEQITWQRCGRTVFERVQDGQQIQPCDRVRVDSSAGYGQAATLRLFDQSTLDLWAKADVQLEQLDTSRWNTNRQVVLVRQYGGYVRYDLRDDQMYADVAFEVEVYDTRIQLQPGGSYSVALQPVDRRVQYLDEGERRNHVIDIAVRQGVAMVASREQQAVLQPGQRITVDLGGSLSPLLPAQWQLLRDGDFMAFSEAEYNNTTIPLEQQPLLPRATSWQVFSGPAGEAPGFFQIVRVCPFAPAVQPCTPDDTVPAARFIRSGGQTRGFVTGIRQTLGYDKAGIDISEFPGLLFSIQLQVREQSLALTGERGSECPVMVRFLHKRGSPLDAEQERVICFYTDSRGDSTPQRAPGIIYMPVEQDAWHSLTVDLRSPGWIPEARYLRSVEVYANGHDYDVHIARVSLLGLQEDADERYRMPVALDASTMSDLTNQRVAP